MATITLFREDCEKCGHCVEIDETIFNFDDDDRAMLIGGVRDDDIDELEVEDTTTAEQAVENCTGECIELEED